MKILIGIAVIAESVSIVARVNMKTLLPLRTSRMLRVSAFMITKELVTTNVHQGYGLSIVLHQF